MKIILFFFLIFNLSIFSHAAITRPSKVQHKEDLLRELEGIKDAKTDIQYYSEIITDYQTGKYNSLNIRLNSLIRKFPKSSYIDNSLNLAGKLALERKNYLEALKHFQKIISMYPFSNKVPSAQFGKAMAYKFMNLNAQSKNTLIEMRKKYPNSPEYFRAEAELKLIK